MSNKTIKELLKWIQPSNEDQAHWLKNYIYKKKEIRIMNELIFRLSEINTTKDKIIEFKKTAINWPDTAETRALCTLMKAAWNQKNKRKKSPLKNGEFSITDKAYKELKRLATEEKMSLSKVIENAILNLAEIRKKVVQTKKRQNSLESKEIKLQDLIDENKRKQSWLDELISKSKIQNNETTHADSSSSSSGEEADIRVPESVTNKEELIVDENKVKEEEVNAQEVPYKAKRINPMKSMERFKQKKGE